MKSKMHILLVEDEEHLAVGIKYNLEAEGYLVVSVEDGPSALKHIEDHRGETDLVILDLMLPGMSGYAVCETLRDADENMPVLILSARSLTEDRTRGFDVGADQYLTKPFELDELLSRVNNLLSRFSSRAVHGNNSSLSSDVFEFGKAKVNFNTFEVTVDGKSVQLTRLLMKLLKYFVENEGRVISRAELLANVWDMPGHLNTRAPDQFIRRLRTTFELDAATPRHFITVRDAGYRFVAAGGSNEDT